MGISLGKCSTSFRGEASANGVPRVRDCPIIAQKVVFWQGFKAYLDCTLSLSLKTAHFSSAMKAEPGFVVERRKESGGL